jgi:release factor glutamine methyltransferase
MPELAVPLGRLIGQGAERLRRSGVPGSRREALRIWSELTGAPFAHPLVDPTIEVQEEPALQFQAAIERRSAGEPLAYVTGTSGFRHLTLRADRRALIPRPETEGLVELLLQRVLQGVVADVGTGSGCIALSLALEGRFQAVLAIDCSTDALELARQNSASVPGSSLVGFVQGDLTRPLRPESLDALISNPPYLTDGEYAGLESSVRDWEPELALKAGSDGLEPTASLLRDGMKALRPGGWIALEVDCSRAEIIRSMASGYGWQEVSLHQDLFGRERYLLARRSKTR